MIESKKLLFVTGTRADFGKLEPLARAAQQSGFLITFFITGMHMMARYGETRIEVKRFVDAQFFEFVNQREGDALDFILSKTILGFSDFIHEQQPDLVVIHGDRVEAMAASIVCAMRYIRSAHIEGGEVSGTIDESIRHCNTKLCATHFVSSEVARQRVITLGETSDRIFNIGSPELDSHGQPSGVSLEEVRSRYDITFDDFGIVIFHPVTSELRSMGAQAQSLFAILQKSGKSFVVIAPNNDLGTLEIFSVLDKLPNNQFRVLPSMRFHYFSELMRHASAMIGNSSTGVREAPFLGLPSLDIGSRQTNRALAPSVHSCSAMDEMAIQKFIDTCWGKKNQPDQSFGDGQSSQKFVDVLHAESFWELPEQKIFVDKS